MRKYVTDSRQCKFNADLVQSERNTIRYTVGWSSLLPILHQKLSWIIHPQDGYHPSSLFQYNLGGFNEIFATNF
jgi:hypothetical protein